MMSRRRPVVTGLGVIAAAGCGVAAVWDALRSGRSGLGPLTLFSSSRYGRHPVGQVRADVDRLAGRTRGSRSDKLAWIAAGLWMPKTGDNLLDLFEQGKAVTLPDGSVSICMKRPAPIPCNNDLKLVP